MNLRDEHFFSFPAITPHADDAASIGSLLASRNGGNVYCELATALGEAAGAPAPVLRELHEAGRLLARAAVHLDKIVDLTDESPTQRAVGACACQFASLRGLHTLFAPDSRFWQELERLTLIYSHACLREWKWRSGALPWHAFDQEEALRLTLQKNVLARAAVFGVCELTHDYSPCDTFVDAVTDFTVAAQIIDDACDWRVDLHAGAPSLVTALLPWMRELHPAAAEKRAERSLLVDGDLARLLVRGMAHARRASTSHALASSPTWRRLSGGVLRVYEDLLSATRPES